MEREEPNLDEQELDPQEPDSGSYAQQDTAGSMNIWHLILIFFGGIGVCVLFFALGFLIGKNQGRMEQMVSSRPPEAKVSAEHIAGMNAKGSSAQEEMPLDRSEGKAGSQSKLDFYNEVNRNFKTEPAPQEPVPSAGAGSSRPVQKPEPLALPPEPAASEPQDVAIVTTNETGKVESVTPATEPAAPPTTLAPAGEMYRVQVGAFRTQEESQNLVADLQKKGYESFIEPPGGRQDSLYRVQLGPYTTRAGALEVIGRLKKSGMSALLKKY